ncbi:hypothetical protein M0802_011357 [Mischocyttarus mexicanus]|nr:hypothetical protein M0802_011357 [Mischocyttarus mexicanus]
MNTLKVELGSKRALKNFINGTNHFICAELNKAGNCELTEAIKNAIIIEKDIIETDLNLLHFHRYQNSQPRFFQEERPNYRQNNYRNHRSKNYEKNKTCNTYQNSKLQNIGNAFSPLAYYETERFDTRKDTPPIGAGLRKLLGQMQEQNLLTRYNKTLPFANYLRQQKQELTQRVYLNDAENAVTMTSTVFSLPRNKKKSDVEVCNNTNNTVVMTIFTPSIRPLEESTTFKVGKFKCSQATSSVDDRENKIIMRGKLLENLGNKKFLAN